MQLIHLDLEIDRPEFVEDPTFNVIPNYATNRALSSVVLEQ